MPHKHQSPANGSAAGWLLAVLPIGMLVLWVAVLVAGRGRIDALGNPLGGDFAMFYTSAKTAADGQWHSLYDEVHQQRLLLVTFPGLPRDTYLPYRYPPTLALLMAPLGALPYESAWLVFLGISIGVWAWTWQALIRSSLPIIDPAKRLWLAAMIGAPVAIQTVMDGQASLLWFCIAAWTWMNIQRQRWLTAGAILALAACKPNVLLLMGLVWVLRYPRLLLGVIPMGAVLLSATVMVASWETLEQYIALGRRLAVQSWAVETPYWKVQSLLSWSQLAFGDSARAINLAMGLVLAVLIAVWWRRQSPLVNDEERGWIDLHALTSGLVVNALFNPYTPVYDLCLLSLVAFAWLVRVQRAMCAIEWMQRRDVQVAALCLWIGPILSQSLSRTMNCPQQWMPLLLAMFWLIVEYGRRHSRMATSGIIQERSSASGLG